MADQKKQEKPQTFKERLMETGMKAVEKRTKEKIEQRMDMGERPKDILQNLMASISGQSSQGQQEQQQELLQQLLGLSQVQVPSGERMGLGRSLISGRGFERPEYQEPLGLGKAIQVRGLQQKEAEQKRKIPQEQLQFLGDLVKFAKETKNRELLNLITQHTQGQLEKTLPGIPTKELGPTETGTGIDEEGYFETDPMTGDLTPQALKRQIQIRTKAAQDAQAIAKQGADLSKKRANFGRVVATMERAMSKLKGGIQEDAAGSLMKGISGDIRIFFKRPGVGRAASYDAQVKETALAMNNILTGQNRVIRGVIELILSTFPTRKMPEDMISQLMSQTVENAYGIFKAFEKGGLSPEDLNVMTQQELNNIDIKGLVGRLQLTPEDLQEREKFVQQVLQATPAQRRGLKIGVTSEIDRINAELEEINKQLGVR